MFGILNEIVHLQTNALKELPVKVLRATYILLTSYLYPTYILLTSYLHPTYILLTSYLRTVRRVSVGAVAGLPPMDGGPRGEAGMRQRGRCLLSRWRGGE